MVSLRPSFAAAKNPPIEVSKPAKPTRANQGSTPIEGDPTPIDGGDPIDPLPSSGWTYLQGSDIHNQGLATPYSTQLKRFDISYKNSDYNFNFGSPTHARLHDNTNSHLYLNFSQFKDTLEIQQNINSNIYANMGAGGDIVTMNPNNVTGHYDLNGGAGNDRIKFQPFESGQGWQASWEANDGGPQVLVLSKPDTTIKLSNFETIQVPGQSFTPQQFMDYINSL